MKSRNIFQVCSGAGTGFLAGAACSVSFLAMVGVLLIGMSFSCVLCGIADSLGVFDEWDGIPLVDEKNILDE